MQHLTCVTLDTGEMAIYLDSWKPGIFYLKGICLHQ